MQFDKNALISDWEKTLSRKKLAAILRATEAFEDILRAENPMFKEERELLGLSQFSGEELNAYKQQIEQFLVGSGPQGSGLIGLILGARDKEAFRTTINEYGGGLAMPEETGNTVKDAVAVTKRWLCNRAWSDLGAGLALAPVILDHDTGEAYPSQPAAENE